ncbi:MAG: hypothetical protein V4507_01080 [Verrucomicrobiota bacterium]
MKTIVGILFLIIIFYVGLLSLWLVGGLGICGNNTMNFLMGSFFGIGFLFLNLIVGFLFPKGKVISVIFSSFSFLGSTFDLIKGEWKGFAGSVLILSFSILGIWLGIKIQQKLSKQSPIH